MWVGQGGGVVVKKDPCQTGFQFREVPCMVGIKLQFLCDIRIGLAVGSLPYPRFKIGTVPSLSVCLEEGL